MENHTENHKKSARYGYHVPHLLIAGSVCGAVMVVLGGILLHGGLVPWLLAVTAVAVGAVFLAFTGGLGWFVYCGRPLITERMLDTVPWTGTEKVLDVGCGPGLSLIAAAKRLTTGKAIGIDKWAVIHGETHNSKAITVENARIEGVLDRVEVHDGDAGAIPFPDATFDTVVSSFVFHHLAREVQTKALREIVRVTKAGGRILITDDRTDGLASELRALGLEQVENRRMVFPTHLLRARKASAPMA
jgi:SAM-dependent methyltransferase